jgi:SAM-dependent methyltransferase
MSNPVASEQRRRFFYAEADAGLYDVSIGWVVPHYELLHESVLTAVSRAASSASAANEKLVILDVGAGTGRDTLAILEAFPTSHVVAVELCKPMLDQLDRRLSAASTASELRKRCTLVHADILSDFSSGADWRAIAPPGARTGGYSAILSSLTVHHFDHVEKQLWYERAAAALSPSGIAVIADLFSHIDPALSAACLDYDLRWMQRHFNSEDVTGADDRFSQPERQRLLEAWRQHYRADNRLEPIESTDSEIGQADMMRYAGFSATLTQYRHSLSGVLVGLR